MQFTWDERKAAQNLRKHGVSFVEASTVFTDPLAILVDDILHPERALLIGLSARAHTLVVVHAEIDATSIRLISARLATRHERRTYEEGTERS